MIVDLFLVYQFLKRLATPFEKWKAFQTGVIDKDGNILKKADDRRTVEERESFGKYDLMLLKLKRLLAKIPGGSSRIASYAAALWLIKENEDIERNGEFMTEEHIKDKLEEYKKIVINEKFDDLLTEDMSAGSGAIAGIGIGANGEPGVTKKQANRYKKKNEKNKPVSRYTNMV